MGKLERHLWLDGNSNIEREKEQNCNQTIEIG